MLRLIRLATKVIKLPWPSGAKSKKVCGEHNCYKVLGIGESKTAMSTMDSMNHAQLFKGFAITRSYKIAWVELNQEAIGNLKFLEMVLLNRGMLNGMLFAEVEEAKQWLLAE